MSCCGSQRAAMRQGAAAVGQNSAAGYSTGAMEFEYNGSGELRIAGPMTGAVYSFPGPGARAVVEAADAPSLAIIPALRPVR